MLFQTCAEDAIVPFLCFVPDLAKKVEKISDIASARAVFCTVLEELGVDDFAVVEYRQPRVPKVDFYMASGRRIALRHPAVKRFRRALMLQPAEYHMWTLCGDIPLSLDVFADSFPDDADKLYGDHEEDRWQSVLSMRMPNCRSAKAIFFMSRAKLTSDQWLKLVGAVRYFGSIRNFWPNESNCRTRVSQGNVLSDIQLKCVVWSAKGKTAQDVAEILRLSVSNVRYNLRGVQQAYNCRTVGHAVALAARDYYIPPL